MEQTSDFIFSPEGEVSGQFSEMTEMASSGFNVLVRAKKSGQWWVLKALKSDIRQVPEYRYLLQKEYDILSRLQHPNVVKVDALEEVEGYGMCIVMEWIDGDTLEEWLAHPHKKSERKQIAHQLIDALEFVHSQQVVHRDLKLSNVMVTHNGGTVKLIDFGFSDTDNYAVLKGPAGTSGYVSPEQMNGMTPDVRNDIYSLGIILQKMGLGLSYRLVAKRCLRPLSHRFANVTDLRQHLHTLHRRLVAASVFLLLLVVGCACVAIYNKVYSPATIYDVVADFKVGNLEYTSWGGGMVSVKAANQQDSCIEIPASVKYQGMTYKVDEVEEKAFAHQPRLRCLVLPNTEFHVMKQIFLGSPQVRSICFRCSKPPVLGNDIWSVKMSQVFDAVAFDSIVLYVPQGSLAAYRQSPWGRFKQIHEYDD